MILGPLRNAKALFEVSWLKFKRLLCVDIQMIHNEMT